MAAEGRMSFSIGARVIGPGQPCYIIGEVGLAHDGSLAQAHAYVDAVERAGADACKFQCHLGDPMTEWRVRPEWGRDESRQEYWKRTGFSEAQWQELARHCAMVGVEFLCSPFSVEAVRLLDPLVRAWKVPSGRIADMALLDAIAKTGKPVLLSAGMCTEHELVNAQGFLWDYGQVKRLQCTTAYPCLAEQVGLPALLDWADGLSDHSGTIFPGIAAAALGCQVLEVHVCWSKDMGGFDTAASITVEQLAELVRGVRFVEAAMKPVDKHKMAEQLSETRRVFMGVSA